MRRRSLVRALAGIAGLAGLAGGCSLVVDTSGLAGPVAAPLGAVDGGGGGGVLDASSDASPTLEDAASDAGPASFVDLFDRPDDEAVGNGWRERTPAAFAIRSHAAEKAVIPSTSTDYLDNIVTRPPSDGVPADVDGLVEFTLQTQPAYPQMYLRGTVGAGSDLDAYGIFVESDGSHLDIARQRGSAIFQTLTSAAITATVHPGQLYRLRFHVEGTTAVSLVGSVDEKNASDGSWTTLATVSTVDSTSERITGPGLAGFSAENDGPGPRYSRFEWRALQ